MLIYPAIDLFGGKAVRLFRGDYRQMTVYSEHPEETACAFREAGAEQMHVVDLEGARSGEHPNADTVLKLKEVSGLFTEVGGGIRNPETVEYYLSRGIDRVILGTAAVDDPVFLESCVSRWGNRIAVGVDIRDGYVAVRGWTQKSDTEAFAFCRHLADIGVRTLIVTDISRDGAMMGANTDLYRKISRECDLDLIASGGVSTLDDIRTLRSMDLHGAIIGKAYYTGAIKLEEAIEVAK